MIADGRRVRRRAQRAVSSLARDAARLRRAKAAIRQRSLQNLRAWLGVSNAVPQCAQVTSRTASSCAR